MPRKTTKRVDDVVVTENRAPLDLDYQLNELPSSQHRAGLAGLVLMTQWLDRQSDKQGICQLTRLDENGATLRIDQKGLAALFDEVYAASREEQEYENLLENNRTKKVKPPSREVEREVIDKKGKVKKKKYFIYLVPIPKGSMLLDLDPTADGENGLWIKLWRDMVWKILRGVPATREPYISRADGEVSNDVVKTWEELNQPSNFTVDLPSTYFIGAQANNAEDVPFKDRARFQFLLHFWPYIAQIYIPAVVNFEGEREFLGYALAIPDIAELKTFCEELPMVLKHSRGAERAGYRPRDAVIDLAIEGALDIMYRLNERLSSLEASRSTADLLLGIDVIHLNKEGNNIRILSSSRIDPELQMIDEYRVIKSFCWDAGFRKQRLLNLVKGAPWYQGFDAMLSTLPYEQSIGSKTFRHDIRETFKNKINTIEEEIHLAMKENEETSVAESENITSQTLSCEALIYRLVGSYISQKLKHKYQLEWQSVKEIPSKKNEYEEKREKIAKDAFLAVRSRTGIDFIDYFTATLCSTPQYLSEDQYTLIAQALYQQTDQVRTLTMLALSARS